jgi:hypothetical protein
MVALFVIPNHMQLINITTNPDLYKTDTSRRTTSFLARASELLFEFHCDDILEVIWSLSRAESLYGLARTVTKEFMEIPAQCSSTGFIHEFFE